VKELSRRSIYYYDSNPSYTYKWSYFSINTSTVRYQNFDNQTEKIYIEQLQNNQVEVQLISPGSRVNKSDVVDLKYSFYISTPTEKDVYTWMLKGWSPCTKQCSGGNTTSTYKCFNVRTNETVDSSMCSSNNLVEIVEKVKACNTHPCKVRFGYMVSKWSTCSVCGRIGEKSRKLFCMRIKEGDKATKADQVLCTGQRKPSIVVKCYRRCPKRSTKCVERSHLCANFVKKGFCSYRSVKTLCCRSCSKGRSGNELRT